MPCHMFAFIVIVFAFNSNCILADCISNGIFVVQFILVMWVIKIFNNVFAFRLLPQNVNGCHLRKSYHSIHMISRKNYYLKSQPNTDISDADGWVLRYPKDTLLLHVPQKVLMLIGSADEIIAEYFGVRTSFDIVICQGSWEMEIQVISRRRELPLQYDDTKSVAITDYRLKEIIIRHDVAKFGHYLHE